MVLALLYIHGLTRRPYMAWLRILLNLSNSLMAIGVAWTNFSEQYKFSAFFYMVKRLNRRTARQQKNGTDRGKTDCSETILRGHVRHRQPCMIRDIFRQRLGQNHIFLKKCLPILNFLEKVSILYTLKISSVMRGNRKKRLERNKKVITHI